jgi:hypothetical protein
MDCPYISCCRLMKSNYSVSGDLPLQMYLPGNVRAKIAAFDYIIRRRRVEAGGREM